MARIPMGNFGKAQSEVERIRMPENQTVWRLCCLPAARPPLLRSLWVRLRAKIGI